MSLDILLKRLESYGSFFDENHKFKNGLELGNHQLLPVFDAVENGLRRFFLAYGTGAGKTLIPLHIIKHLKARREPHRTLVIAPYQTILENWDQKTLQYHNLSMSLHTIKDQGDARIPSNANFVTLNFDKLPEGRSYLEGILAYAAKADLIIIDEFHNLKNHDGQISKGFQKIVEVSKDARLIALSATPAPDRLRDLGIALYAIDPDRYAHYKDHPFDATRDPEAIWELHESGKMRFFSRNDVATFFNLPSFTEHEPVQVEMSQQHVQDYFNAYSQFFELGGTLHALERISIAAMLSSKKTKRILREKLEQGYALNFFSHLRNPPKHGSEDEGIFYQLETMLKEIGAKNIASIHGDIAGNQRERIQEEMRAGKIDALINQWNCSSEGFSETAGKRPVLLVPLRSPFSPGMQEQIIGRSYRPGQLAPVDYMEFHPNSLELCSMIENHIRNYARERNKRIKTSWFPSLYASDAYKIRKDKEREINLLLNRRPSLENTEGHDVDSIAGYAKLLSKKRIIDSTQDNESFGSGTGKVIKYVGIPYENGLLDNAEPLGKDYNREDILLYPPGKTNFFLARYIEKLKQDAGQTKKPWKIADLGCCSSAVFTQARLLWQALHHNVSSFDEIYNIDGHPGFVSSAQQYIHEKKWLNVIPKLEIEGITKQDLGNAKNKLQKNDYHAKLHFLQANFIKDQLGNDYDVIVASQCLQYNDQNSSRDIESILMNVNHSLKVGGHYLTVMTGNSFHNSFTKAQDIQNYTKMLEAYGFEIIGEPMHLQGRKGSKTVLRPFHFIHAQKKYDHGKEFVDLGGVFPVYATTIEVLTGGYKMKNIKPRPSKTAGPSSELPDGFFDVKGDAFKL